MNNQNQKDASLCEELTYWDFIDGIRPHVVLHDGSLVSGLKVSLVDIECLDDREINHFTMGLRSALNSISEGVNVQFHLTVRSDFKETIDKHISSQAENIHPLVKSISDYREEKLRHALDKNELYRPELFVYLQVPQVDSKKLTFFKKKELFSENAVLSYQETLELLGQNTDTVSSSFHSVGLSTKLLSKNDLLKNTYQFFNPKRSLTEPVPVIHQSQDPDMDDKI